MVPQPDFPLPGIDPLDASFGSLMLDAIHDLADADRDLIKVMRDSRCPHCGHIHVGTRDMEKPPLPPGQAGENGGF